MMILALASLRHRRGGVVASFLAVFLGASILMAFAALLDTAAGPGVSPANSSALSLMASVVGGWGAIIVAAAIVTTVSVTARQRAGEFALLRSAGATPSQVVRLLVGEVLVVGALSVVLAIPVGGGGGYALLRVLRDTHQVDAGVGYRFAGAALGLGGGGSLVAALIATSVTARHVVRGRVQDASLLAALGHRRIGRIRLSLGLLLVVAGFTCAVVTATVLDGKALQTQAIAAEGAILSSLGFALLAPVILGTVTAALGPLLTGVGGAPGQLSVLGIRQRLSQASTPVMPIVVCTAIATGTLYLQSIWNSARITVSADDKNVETLNYVVVGMIAIFAATMLVNLLVADLAGRRDEFARLRLAGATPEQLLWLVGFENLLTLVTGLLLGSLASLLTVVPYSLAVANRAIPNASIGTYLAVLAVVVGLTAGASLTAARRSVQTSAIAVMSAG